MWNHTKITDLLGIDYPIMQGPFGGNLSSVELTATVSNAGGLGGYGAYTMSPQEIFDVDKQIKAATNKPYNINLWVSDHDIPQGGLTDDKFAKTIQQYQPYFDELGIPLPEKPAPFQSRFENQLDVILDIRPKVFSFMFGVPSADVLEECRKKGIVTVGAATTLDEAIFLEAAGIDMIIASGFEAGGHRPSFLASAESSLMGTFALVQLMREKIKTPIIAAGGIATGKGVAAALALGADAAQIGTAFLATDESNALPIHREMLFSEASKYTTLSRAYTGRLGRGITSRIAKDLIGKEENILPFPLQTTLISPLRKAALEQQKWDMILFWGGQISPILKHTKAKDLMHSLIEETTSYFNDLKA
ncbi:NAD(P)H-dependent flavin oxidoreductase [Flavobacterium pectinovorum]|uniref:Propionate 3-nitronate monooxygenase n=1 Tax=Flavobacterium pectinovorum TaxID=29533 RepID=A0AB36P372_9FLAO|nr:nitronate monooxygenase [Flavobacterium pectinovorum]OXB04409.1 2-nitropropane dioxygenase [Flavobacterium pectinovorum]SHL57319.1 nitronate monooxygenase [Flavobacterium pectinovorum]